MMAWRGRILEFASVLVFQGILAQDLALQRAGDAAVADLIARGFAPPSTDETIRVYSNNQGLSGTHAGAWRPGVISLRLTPKSQFSTTTYLRHELYHEFANRTCKNRQRLWEKEAGALAFSGESASPGATTAATAIERLRRNSALDLPLDDLDYQTLQQLVAQYGWPERPCARNEILAKLLISADDLQTLPLSFEIISLPTGRVLISQGDPRRRAPLGSVIKLALASALPPGGSVELKQALATSDSDWFLKRLATLDFNKLLNLSAVSNWKQFVRAVDSAKTESRARFAVGERDGEREYPLMLSLEELGWLMRNSLLGLAEPSKRFGGQTVTTGGTLSNAPEEFKSLRQQLRALVKTGTASTVDGDPLVGHLVLAWPEDAPNFLAVFRKGGVRGAGLASDALKVIAEMRSEVELRGKPVSVHLRRVSISDFKWERAFPADDCVRLPVQLRQDRGDPKHEIWATTCGFWKLPTGSTFEFVPGLLEESNGELLLHVDAESYADGVLLGEADRLRGNAREALRAVALWNGVNGEHRHFEYGQQERGQPGFGGVCDTSHCMVFSGQSHGYRPTSERTSLALLRLLDEIQATDSRERWLQFSKGGDQPWIHGVTESRLAGLLQESLILELNRRRDRDGTVNFDITYADNQESVSCEALRRKLRLPSCPDRVEHDPAKKLWRFSGAGLGHGAGLNIGTLFKTETQNRSARDILQAAYRPIGRDDPAD